MSPHGNLQVRKIIDGLNEQMSPASHVDEAAIKAKWLTWIESRGSGDTKKAMARISRRLQVPYGTIWSLRYRRPSSLCSSAYAAICSAYSAEIERQVKLSAHERTITNAKTWAGRALNRAADAMDGQTSETLGKDKP